MSQTFVFTNSRAFMRAHEQWYERGKTGEGQIALEGLNLRGGTVASDLCGARLARCDLSRFSRRAGSWEEIELGDRCRKRLSRAGRAKVGAEEGGELADG